MLKYECNHGVSRLEVKGNIDDVLAEATYMIRRMYGVIKKQSEDAAEDFKDKMILIVGDPESPVWEDDPGAMKNKVIEKLEELAEILKRQGET